MVNPGDAYGRLFNQKDYSAMSEAIFWKKYSVADGVFHDLNAMQVALYEGSWEKYHKDDAFAATTNQSDWFFGEVLRWGDMLFECGLKLNTKDTD